MIEILPKIAKMQASYALGKPLALPMNFTISVSYRCNSRCKTCNVWQRPNDDFTIEEYDKTFASIGSSRRPCESATNGSASTSTRPACRHTTRPTC